MKTYKENLTAYIHVIEMCDKYNAEHGTDVKPWNCVKYGGVTIFKDYPVFDFLSDDYTFAIAILEANPVFIGNKVFLKNAQRFITISESIDSNDIRDDCCSWNPPKRETVTINGVELPRPLKEPSANEHEFMYNGKFHFNDYQEFRKWEDYFTTLLREARDKEG